MGLTKKRFISDYRAACLHLFAAELEELSPLQQYQALAFVVKGYYASDWAQTKAEYDHHQQKQVYYFSIEFLPGRLLASNLLNLGIEAQVTAGLAALGLDAEAVFAQEGDPGLGNGGLGRLASAFLDAMAAVGMAGNGNGIRYEYGLFEQRFVSGYQVELPDDWLRHANVWETRKDNRAVIVRFGGQVDLQPGPDGLEPVYQNDSQVLAVPYDTAMVGYHNHQVNTMRLWQAEPVPGHVHTIDEKVRINAITQILYPDDSDTAGRELRLRQEYFFTSAGVQSIITHYRRFHQDLHLLPKFVAIHINDTHPAMAVLELMRVLLDDGHLPWEDAWTITQETLSYTNHTLMSEALETWPVEMFARLLPRLMQIASEIDARFLAEQAPQHGLALAQQAAPIQGGYLRMAHLAVIGSHAVNGVAKLHTQLLKSSVLKDLYQIYPERFNNKTNGITPRRWVQLANPDLAALLDQSIGLDWRNDPRKLKALTPYLDDPDWLSRLMAAKLANKQRLAQVINTQLGLTVPLDAIFDVQVKRLHAYKRQLLHVFGILEHYLALHRGETRPPRVHIFGAKAAPSYRYAKAVIKLINAVADLVNHDPLCQGQLAVAFLPNYGVSLAERIIPAADVSEQISLAGTEASGTSNMKLMANGALTLATLDGANIEILAAAGESAMVTFGLTTEEVAQQKATHAYSASALYDRDPLIHQLVDALTDGTIPGLAGEGQAVRDELLTYNDTYFVLADLHSYLAANRKLDQLWQTPQAWAQAALKNIAASGAFSADLTVMRYGREVWDVLPSTPIPEA